MIRNPSLVGFSLLLLSCASPTLGSPAEPVSVPSSPTLGFNPGLSSSFNPGLNPGFNPGPNRGFSPVDNVSTPTTPVLDASAPPSSSALDVPTAAFSSEGAPSVTVPTSPTDVVAANVVPTTPVAQDSLAQENGSLLTEPSASLSDKAFSTQVDLQADEGPTATPAAYTVKHSQIPSSAHNAHKKLASKLKSNKPALAMVSAASSPDPTPVSAPEPTSSPAVPDTSAIPSSISSQTDASLNAVNSDVPDVTLHHFAATRSILQPTPSSLDDPNPAAHSQSASDASQRARRSTILAALLILGTLGALGGGVLCFKCGVLPCCHSKGGHRKSRASLERAAEEGLQKPRRVASTEKSIIPGAPPVADFRVLSSDSHTPSCSTCPDSMTGMKSGVSGGASSWRVYATNEEGQFEDVTHVLSSDPFSVHSADSGDASAASWSQRNSADSTGTGSSGDSRAQKLVHSRTESRASESGASMTAESYKSCESRYSTPSLERHSRDGPPPSASQSASSSFRSPSPPASVSVLLLTPEQGDYAGLADAALTRAIPAQLATVVESEPEDMELDSQWDVAQAYSAPAHKRVQSAESGACLPASDFAEQTVGTVDLGGRTCVLMRG
ncbi:hypothetical protein BV20DRAFT_971988 [Pilatotrama ljubarskyi]|nr:hypothetical protein BV20DRAFT_971988 [Pilatotrama ljubarskyi]